MIKMNKKLFKMSKIEKKLKLENLTRCINCRLFCNCAFRKEEIVICESFKELNVKKQLIIIPLEEYSELKGRKDLFLSSFC